MEMPARACELQEEIYAVTFAEAGDRRARP